MAVLMQGIETRKKDSYAEGDGIAREALGAIRTLIAFTAETRTYKRYKHILETTTSPLIVRSGFINGFGLGLVFFTLFCMYAVAMWYGSVLVRTSDYSGGQVLTVFFAILIGGFSLGQAAPHVAAISKGLGGAKKIFDVIKREPKMDVTGRTGKQLIECSSIGKTPVANIHSLRFENVSFAYPMRSDILIFENLSLSIQTAKTTAIVGSSGTGKSTLLALLQRFYDPQIGQVLINGQALPSLDLQYLRRKLIGYVGQETILFGSMSLYDNIKMGSVTDVGTVSLEGSTFVSSSADGYSDEDPVIQAAKSAFADSFIRKMPEGYNTIVGEGGSRLSGGQRQRISIARAMLKKAPILLLDEATSALDATSESIVQSALENYCIDIDGKSENATVIVVAHRLSTIWNADHIVVLDRRLSNIDEAGKGDFGGSYVAEEGIHDNLMRNEDGIYRQLVQLQTTDEGNDDPPKSHNSQTNLSEEEDCVTAARTSGSVDRSHFENTEIERVESEDANSKIVADESTSEMSGNDNYYYNIYRVLLLTRPEWTYLFFSCIASAVFGAVWPVMGLALAEIIDIFYYTDMNKLRNDAQIWSIIFVVLATTNLVCATVTSTLAGIISARLGTRLRSKMFDSTISQEIGWHDEDVNNSGAIAMRLASDAESVSSFLQNQLGLLIQNIVTLVLGLSLAFAFSWELTLVVIGMIPLFGMAAYFQFKALAGYAGLTRPMYEDAAVMTSDAVDSIRTVASYTLEDYLTRMYAMRLEMPLKRGERAAIISGIAHGCSYFLQIAPLALAFYIGAIFVNDGLISFRDTVVVIFVVLYASMGASQARAATPDLGKLSHALSSVFSIIDRRPKIDSRGENGYIIPSFQGEIFFDSVTFSYPTRPEATVFHNLNLFIPSGHTVAVVGESGSGKSTLLSLLLRFYDPNRGNVQLDGHNLKDLNLRWFRNNMAFVQQEPILFDTTIKENIFYGSEDCTNEDAILAAGDANAKIFIDSFPEGFDTIVGERGMQLSGGQKQRIAIARAIVRKPKILLLDEATSALDAESEYLVQDALERFRKSRTTIIVAHRLSTIKNADTIAVFKRDLQIVNEDEDTSHEQGGSYVAECGTHEELMNKDEGAYHALVRLQTIVSMGR